MRSQLDSAQVTTLQMRSECTDLRLEMNRAVPAHAAVVKVCHTSSVSWHTTSLTKPRGRSGFICFTATCRVVLAAGAICRTAMRRQAHGAKCVR